MSEFVKKTMVGYKTVPGGHSDSDCTHVILTLEEYDYILSEKRQAERDTWIAKSNADKAVVEAKRNAAYMVQQARQEAQEKVAAIQGELEEEREESAHQRALNANLLRQQRTSQCRSKPKAEERAVRVCRGKLRGKRDWFQGWGQTAAQRYALGDYDSESIFCSDSRGGSKKANRG